MPRGQLVRVVFGVQVNALIMLSLLGAAILGVTSSPTIVAGEPIKDEQRLGGAGPVLSGEAAGTRARVSDVYGKLPLQFEANRGQTDSQVKFLSRGSGHTLFLTPSEAVLVLTTVEPADWGERQMPRRRPDERGKVTRSVLRTSFVGANREPRLDGEEELPGTANHFIGNDPEKWRTSVPTYPKVRYHDLYPGIDLVYYGNQRQLEYDFVVRVGADPGRILLDFAGADRIEVTAEGDLVLDTAAGEVRHRKPVIYQEVDGVRREIAGGYTMKGPRQIGFRVSAYDRSRPLVIDPVLVYSTYLGGSSEDIGFGIAVDNAGSAYVTGYTCSPDFPTTAGAVQTTHAGSCDAFVTKLDATGSARVYSTYLGGSSSEIGYDIAVDGAGSAYVTGSTCSTNFPTTAGAVQTTHAGSCDAFVTKLNATGSARVYSTYLGGSSADEGLGIAVDGAGSAYVTGYTCSTDFPTTAGAMQTTNASGGCTDAFVAKLDTAGSARVYSTYLGRSQAEVGHGIAVDGAGSAYVTGSTCSPDFPTTAGAAQTTIAGSCNAFVTKLDATGSAPVYSTYLGGSGGETGNDIAVDGAGSAYVTGVTCSRDFPTTAGAAQTTNAGSCIAFVTKMDATGAARVYSTYLGGSCDDDSGEGIAVDGVGSAYVTGYTCSDDFPTTAGAVQTTNAGGYDTFVTKLDATGSALMYSTYLGGSGEDIGFGIAVDNAGSAYVTGYTCSTDFPTTAGAVQRTSAGCYDAFVAKVADVVLPPFEAVVLIIDEESIDNGNPPNFFSREAVNDDVAQIGVRAQLRFFRDNAGRTITLYTGQVGDEGWFALKKVPESWTPAGGLAGYIGNPAANPEDPPPHGTGPGLGAPDSNGDRESLLDKVPDVTPLRATGLKNLEGRHVCAVVYDSDISINYGPLTGNLKGANLGTVAFQVNAVTPLTGYSSSSLPQVEIMILDAREVCRRALVLLSDIDAPAPTSLLDPFDVLP